jgi:hypothetical protein
VFSLSFFLKAVPPMRYGFFLFIIKNSKSMKKILFLLLAIVLFVLASCTKETPPETTDDYENVSDENDLSAFSSDDSGLEDRASTTMKIDSLTLWNEFSTFKKVKAETYPRFANYFILHSSKAFEGANNEGISIEIHGKNFGKLQGTSTVSAYITGRPYPNISVQSWDSTKIKVTVDSLPSVKNVVLKLAVKVGEKTKTKTAKCVGSNMTIGGTGSGTQRQYIHYPLSLWEINNQLSTYNRTLEGNEGAIDATYKPRVFDVLRRTIAGKVPKNWDYQFGFVLSVSAPNSAGFQKVKIKERNRKGDGRIETATWLYKNGVFTCKDFPNFNDFLR